MPIMDYNKLQAQMQTLQIQAASENQLIRFGVSSGNRGLLGYTAKIEEALAILKDHEERGHCFAEIIEVNTFDVLDTIDFTGRLYLPVLLQPVSNQPLQDAIAASPVDMAFTYTQTGLFVLVRMHDLTIEEQALSPVGPFDGTIWTYRFSVQFGWVAIPSWSEIAFYTEKEELHKELAERELPLLTGWQSVPDAAR